MILGVFLFLIVTEAVYEALKLRGKDILSGVIEFFNRALTIVLLSLFMAGWVLSLKNDGLFYIGSTKIYDILCQKFFEWTKFPKEHFLWMFKFIALLISIVWLT